MNFQGQGCMFYNTDHSQCCIQFHIAFIPKMLGRIYQFGMLDIYLDITCKDRCWRMFFEGMWLHRRRCIFYQRTWWNWCSNIRRGILQHRQGRVGLFHLKLWGLRSRCSKNILLLCHFWVCITRRSICSTH